MKRVPTEVFTDEIVQCLILLQNNPLGGRRGNRGNETDQMLKITEVTSLVDIERWGRVCSVTRGVSLNLST